MNQQNQLNKILSSIDLPELELFYKTNYPEIRKYHPHSTTFSQLIEYGLGWVNNCGYFCCPNADAPLVRTQTILDLGTCGGHIPFIYNYFGYAVVGLERENLLWMQEMARLLDVYRLIYSIEKDKSLPCSNCDFITAYNVTFDYTWTPKDWGYFLELIIEENLQIYGELYFLLNYHYKDVSYINVWKKLGLEVHNNTLRYTKLPKWIENLK